VTLRPSPRPALYHRLSIKAKREAWSARAAEPPLRCPRCSAATPARDLLRHLAERCPGPSAPHPASRWLAMPDALKLGVSRRRLGRWLRRGQVRARGEGADRQVLERDLVALVAMARALEAPS